MSRGNWILAAIALLLLVLLSWDNTPPTAPAAKPLTSLKAQDVEQIELFLGDAAQPGIVLQRHSGQWHIRYPLAVAADEFSVQVILQLLAGDSEESLDADTLSLSKLKLDPPLWRVRFNSDVELRVGGIESLRQQRYVLFAGRVYLLPDFNPAPLDGNYADLVSRQLLPSNLQIQRIHWPDGQSTAPTEQQRSLWKSSEAQWTSRPLPGDFDTVTSRVTIDGQDQSLDFLISARQPRLKLIRPDIDVLYNLPASAAAELLPPDA